MDNNFDIELAYKINKNIDELAATIDLLETLEENDESYNKLRLGSLRISNELLILSQIRQKIKKL